MISIIIPAFNEENYLEKTLLSVREQEGEFEIIVVANGCTDDTIGVARKYADRIFSVNVPNVSLARNVGALHAKGELFVFLDADTRLGPNALRSIVEQFGDSDVVGTFYAYPNAPRLRYSLLLAGKNLLHGAGLYAGSSGVIVGRALSFYKAHGFDPKLHVKENRLLIKKMLEFGDYKTVRKTYVTTSTRRYERWGLLRTLAFWVVGRWLLPPEDGYEAVR
jgi:glycosyltransferase involved in cell wall biosynthesis